MADTTGGNDAETISAPGSCPQRGWIETQLSHALGQRVTVGGNIDLKLLPTPYLHLNQAVVGDDDGALKIGVRYLDLELAVGPLLHGEFDITEGRLEGANIRLNLQGDRSIPALPAAPALRANIRLERLNVAEATLTISDPQNGRDLRLDHLNFMVEAAETGGPFRLAGSRGSGAERTKFHGSLTPAPGGKGARSAQGPHSTPHGGADIVPELGRGELRGIHSGARAECAGGAAL